MNRQHKIEVAEETLKIFNQGYYEVKGIKVDVKEVTEKSIKNTVLYNPQRTDEIVKEIELRLEKREVLVEVTKETTLAATRRLKQEGYENVVCLNFASAKNPGGGFLKGSTAQEESLARSSALYPTIIKKSEMYEYNRKIRTPLYSDYMIYSPNVPIIRDDELKLLEKPYCASMITCPSVNKGAIKEKSELKEVEKIMKRRIEKIISVAIENKNEAIVLGSYGCGVFKMNPDDVAKYFKEILMEKGYINQFKKVVFAIYGGGENYEKFKKIIG